MALAIAGERSGVGKTTVTLALLASLAQRKLPVQSFKVGPDYIDPMFHQFVTGRPCRNLDPVLTSESYVQQCFAQHTQEASYALVEGVMGLFDGAKGSDDWASTAHIARLLHLPVLLVLDCSKISRSIAAIAHGYRSFDPQIQLAGVVLNRVGSDRHLELLKAALEPLELPILGVLRRQDNITIPDRHLGLIPTAELSDLNVLVDQLANLGNTCFDWSRLLPLLHSQPPSVSPHSFPELDNFSAKLANPVRLAIARDRAFSFYYADNLDLLAQFGAELVEWSPLADANLPAAIDGLYLGGGFPEVFAQNLAENESARQAVYRAVQSGMPTYAECGGLMYLCQHIIDLQENSWPMVGVLPTTAKMNSRLTLGYRQAIALQNSPILTQGSTLFGHEFHHSCLTVAPDQPLFQLQRYSDQKAVGAEGWTLPHLNLHASYLHLHWGTQVHLLQRFLKQCTQFRSSRAND